MSRVAGDYAGDWTIPRSTAGEGWDPELFVFLRHGEHKVGVSWTSLGLPNGTVCVVTPEDARRAAARLLAIAELAEQRRTESEENS